MGHDDSMVVEDVQASDEVTPVSPRSASSCKLSEVSKVSNRSHDEASDDEVGDVADVPCLVDATVLLEDEGVEGRELLPILRGPEADPVLSLFSLNSRTAKTIDIVRGPLTVYRDLPLSVVPVRTVQISCGRAEGNTIVLRDHRVSMRHFALRLRVARGGLVALDLLDLSSNGTWVNGQCVGKGLRVPLSVGDRIAVLPASRVGREDETGYVMLHDPKGVRCSGAPVAAKACPASASSCSSSSPTPESSPRSAALPTCEGQCSNAEKNDRTVGSCDSKEACSQPHAFLPRALERDLRCGICADALHRCLTLVPCGHNFCTACLVRWRRTSPKCPECRAIVGQATQNNDIDKVVQTFLKAHPSMSRTPEEITMQDAVLHDPDSRACLRWLLRDGPPWLEPALPKRQVLAVPTPTRNQASRRAAPGSNEEAPRRSSAQQAPREHQVQHTPRSSACVVS